MRQTNILSAAQLDYGMLAENERNSMEAFPSNLDTVLGKVENIITMPDLPESGNYKDHVVRHGPKSFEVSVFAGKEDRKSLDPIGLFPNILDSTVMVNDNNSLMELHGILKRDPKDLHLVKGNNKAYNDYLLYIIHRLNKLRDNPEAFWKFAYFISARSNTFKAQMLHHVFPHWHRDMNMKELYLLISKYTLMWLEHPVFLKYRRVYIPKKTDPITGEVVKWRPLGVPTTAWRLYLHTYQCFLMIFLQDRISVDQHGFYKGRGTKTAWEALIKDVLDSPNIYEFDLKGFFPSVDVRETVNLLENEYGLPKTIGRNLLWMSMTPPRLPSELHLDETTAIYKTELDALGNLHSTHPEFDWTDLTSEDKDFFKILPSSIFQTYKIETVETDSGLYEKKVPLKEPIYNGVILKEHFEKYGVRTAESIAALEAYYQVGDYYDETRYYLDLYQMYLPKGEEVVKLTSAMQSYTKSQERAGYSHYSDNAQMEEYISKVQEPLRFEGFPQGAATSPILCASVLGGTVFTRGNCKMYADDGLYYGDFIPETIADTDEKMRQFGLSFATDKSGWVKKDGVWLKPLKFLGLEYNGETGELRASTRKGANLVFDRQQLMLQYHKNILESKSSSVPKDPIFHENVESLAEERREYKAYSHYIKLLTALFKEYESPTSGLHHFFEDPNGGYTSRINPNFRLKINALKHSLEQDINVSHSYYAKFSTRIASFLERTRLASWVYMGHSPEELRATDIFSWDLPIKEGLFGFIIARLYCNGWNFKPEQDFNFTYKPYS
jgi:hypothetical protein